MGRKKKGQASGTQSSAVKQDQPAQSQQSNVTDPGPSQQPQQEGGKKGRKQQQVQQQVEKETSPDDVPVQVQEPQQEVGKKGRKQQQAQQKVEKETPPDDVPVQVQQHQQEPGKKGRKQQQPQKEVEQDSAPVAVQDQPGEQPQQGGKKGRKQRQQQKQQELQKASTQEPLQIQPTPQQEQSKKKGAWQKEEFPAPPGTQGQAPTIPVKSAWRQQPPLGLGQQPPPPGLGHQPPPPPGLGQQTPPPRLGQQTQQPPWRGQPQQQQRQMQQPQQQERQHQQPQSQRQMQQQQSQQQLQGGPQGKGQGRKQHETAKQSEPATPGSSPYSMTPSSSASSIAQSRDSQMGDGMQQLSLAPSPPLKSAKPGAGGDATGGDILPQTTVERRGGTSGRARTTVITNYFPLDVGKLSKALHYDVNIMPDRPKKLFRIIMDKFREKCYLGRWPAYDGNKNLYSSSPLFDCNEISDTILAKDDGKEKEYTVTIKFATYVDLTCLQNYTQRYRGKHILDMDKPMQALQCIDVVLRSAPALSCIPVGRSYFTPPERKFALGDGCILYYGFYQAAILGWKPFVNIDVAHKAFPNSLNMIDLVKEMCPRADLARDLAPYDREAINRHVKQLKVEYLITRNPASRRVYRVNQLDAPSSTATFVEEGGKKMTVEQYFQQKKDVRLRYPNLPTLWVGSRARENKILLPFEFCTILPDQAVNKKMTELQTRNMIRQAATDTKTRLQNIEKAVYKANYNNNNTMREFGISVNPKPQEVEARILTPPSLQYSKKVERVYKGTWRASHFCESAKLTNWSILCLDYRTSDDVLIRLGKDLAQSATAFGMQIDPPKPYTRLGDRNLKSELQQYFTNNKAYQMVVVVLNNRNDTYNYVKRASEIAVGCLTQCLKPNTVSRLNRSTTDNILLKINAKLNGINQRLNDVPNCFKRPCMIMGADVTHPGPDSRDFPSVAAVTASFDCTAFKYSFEWRLQPSRQEMIEDLEEITREHLLKFYRKNRNLKPEKILYVRDGVSDGQFVQVLSVELTAIRAACQKLQSDYKPSVIFIVVQKRHHTRFFPKDPSISEDRNCNVPAGTCVDTDITHPSIVDFYLVSHASIQGVAKPTKYVKLWDDCNMSEDELEILMYYLCHMFARCNRSVSYPAPTYYAHLAAARARVYCEIDTIDMNNLRKEQSRLTIKENISKDLPMFFV